MYSIIRWFEIDAGHRVLRHQGKCRQLHGHRYKVGVTMASEFINNIGVVEDFGDMKTTFGNWLEENFDHGMILERGDWWIDTIANADPGQKIYPLPYPATAEGIAKFLFETFSEMDKRVTSIFVYETPNCCAEWPV